MVNSTSKTPESISRLVVITPGMWRALWLDQQPWKPLLKCSKRSNSRPRGGLRVLPRPSSRKPMSCSGFPTTTGNTRSGNRLRCARGAVLTEAHEGPALLLQLCLKHQDVDEGFSDI
ncbi:unnamed protein product [Ascophyllum nodosum]